jgi:hypothetical protein
VLSAFLISACERAVILSRAEHLSSRSTSSQQSSSRRFELQWLPGPDVLRWQIASLGAHNDMSAVQL